MKILIFKNYNYVNMAWGFAWWEGDPDVVLYFLGSRETTLSDHACIYLTITVYSLGKLEIIVHLKSNIERL